MYDLRIYQAQEDQEDQEDQLTTMPTYQRAGENIEQMAAITKGMKRR